MMGPSTVNRYSVCQQRFYQNYRFPGVTPKYGVDADEANAKDIFHPDPSRLETMKKEFERWQKAVFRPTQSTVSMSCASTISEASSTSGASSASALPTSYSEGLFLPSMSETVFVPVNGEDGDERCSTFLAKSFAAASF